MSAFEVMTTRYNSHCVCWARATASLWGMADDHDLDEPVRLTEIENIRLRFLDNFHIITDRAISLKTIRPGRHAALRFTFENDKFFEVMVSGVTAIMPTDKTVEVNICS
jgi:hypothetical protein